MEWWNQKHLELMWLGCADNKPKLDLLQEEEGGSPTSSLECPGGADSDDYLTASKSGEGHRHRRRWQAERRLAPARLNLPISRSTDANADVTYEIWCFDVQDWLDQYDEVSMCPHIFGSLQGYLGNGHAHYQGV